MKYTSLLGWGIVIYAVMFLTWTAFIAYGFTQGLLPRIIAFLILVAAAVVAGRSLHFTSWRDVLPYSIGWAIIIAILEALIAVPSTGWQVFADPVAWLGYALVILAPLLALERRSFLVHDLTKWTT